MENTPEIRKIEIEEDTLKDLDITRKWSMFMAIIGFIATGIMVIVGLVAGVFLSVFKAQNAPLGITESILLIFIIILAAIYFLPILYLYRFSKHMGNAIRTLDKTLMQKAFKYLKRYYVYMGILIIIILAFYFVAFIASGASLAFLKDIGTGI
ncbi:MAG: hypothetical protein NT092_06195 [Bacteroidia bacterium]|nr:hypothetical protein [Bacteroidia bacterium]